MKGYLPNKNPYPEFITDEASGIDVRSQDHVIWQMGYEAREKEYQRGVKDAIDACNRKEEALRRCQSIKASPILGEH